MVFIKIITTIIKSLKKRGVFVKTISLFVLLPSSLYLYSLSYQKEDALFSNGVEINQKDINFSSKIPYKLIFYPKASLKWSASYSSNPFFSTEELISILKTKDSIKKIKSYYIKKFRFYKWQIIQDIEDESSLLLIAESRSAMFMTVVLRQAVLSSYIKIYVRPVSEY